MIEIVKLEQLKKGDIILIDLEDRIELLTIDKVGKDGLIVPIEWGGLDYNCENPDEIIRVGTKKQKPTIVILARNIALGLSKFWEDKWQKPF